MAQVIPLFKNGDMILIITGLYLYCHIKKNTRNDLSQQDDVIYR